jgi:hypothetical protein
MSLEYDIALIQLKTNLTLSDNASFICLNQIFDLDISQPVYTIGWSQFQKNITRK